jgi:hypothetical protein
LPWSSSPGTARTIPSCVSPASGGRLRATRGDRRRQRLKSTAARGGGAEPRRRRSGRAERRLRGCQCGIEAAITRGAVAVLLLNNDMVVELGFSSCSSPRPRAGVAAACSRSSSPNLLIASGTRERRSTRRPSRPQYRIRRATATRRRPYSVDCACGATLASREAIDEIGLFDEDLSPQDLDLSPAPPRGLASGRGVRRASSAKRISASTGGVLAHVAYYDAQRPRRSSHAPSTRRTSLRRAEFVLAHLAQGGMSVAPRRRAVLAGRRDARRRRLGRRTL